MNFICKKNKKISKFEKKIMFKELNFELVKKFDIVELDKFYKQFRDYMLTCRLLFTNPSFYSTLKFIQLDQTLNKYELAYKEIIWIHEHYNYIEELRLVENDLNNLVILGYNFGFVSKIQFELVKKIIHIVPNIFYTDNVFVHLYPDKSNIKFPTQNQLDYYFDIIEIIILKMYICTKNKINKKKLCIEMLLEDNKYISLISKLKNKLKFDTS